MDLPPDSRAHGFGQVLSSTWFLGLSMCVLGALFFVRVSVWSERNELARLDDLATRQLDLYVAALEGELLRHADLPSLVAVMPDVAALFSELPQPTRRAAVAASRGLAQVAARTGAREIFVIDRGNTVLAASDWYAPQSAFGGRLQGIACAEADSGGARGFMFNPRTAQPEYYFVHAIGASMAEPAVPRACVVARISLAPMESIWVDFAFRPESEKILVLDDHDTVILSSVPYWRYKTTRLFGGGTPAMRQAAGPRPGYPGRGETLAISDPRPVGRGALQVSLPDSETGSPSDYIAHGRPLVSTGWRVVLLSNPDEVRNSVRAIQFGVAALLAFVGVLALYLNHRRKLMRQLLLAQNALQSAHDQLELTVAYRTQELRAANTDLRREMQERQQAEEALLHAQKMAMLGQMSAKISHEISQPLTALRALATNARAFLQRGEFAKVDDNLSTMAETVTRMSAITRQLKTFSGKARRTPVKHRPMSLNAAIDNARALLQERFTREAVELVVPTSGYRVLGDSTQIEQVFVNLFTNALDALREATRRRIEVSVRETADRRWQVGVVDSGPGIPDEMWAHLFEPFYTSKAMGEGLGLGLVICASIVREHGGQLSAESTDCGARFLFDLERAADEGDETHV